MKRLILYGCGNRCKILLRLLKNTDYIVSGIVDSNPANYGKNIEQFVVEAPDKILFDGDIYVCVTFYSTLVHEPIWEILLNQYGVNSQRLISFYDLMIELCRGMVDFGRIATYQPHSSFFLDGTWPLKLGGVESWLKDITLRLNENTGENVFLMTPLEESNVPENIRDYVYDFSFDEPGTYTKHNIEKAACFILTHLPCTLVFSRIDELMLAAFLLKERYLVDIKIIMAVHGSCDGMCTDILSFRTMIDAYVCVSHGIKEELIGRGVAEECVHTMTVPMDYDISLKRTYTLNEKEPLRIGYAGRLELFEKRLDILLKLVEKLEEYRIDYIFSIAGSGKYKETIYEYINKKGLNKKIYLLGCLEHSEINNFWKMQDLSITVSDNEGRCISNMEAMLNGAVPIVTMTVGTMEDVRDGNNGYLVPICDYESMAERIKYIDSHRDLLAILGEQAYNDMKNKVNPEQYVSMWNNLIFQHS